MRRMGAGMSSGIIMALLIASGARAQTLEEICPGAAEGTGALWGAVTDSDTDTILPGASVTAAWGSDGTGRSTEVRAGLDGTYVICHLPLEAALSVHASFATASGPSLDVTMDEVFVRQDLSLSLTGESGGGADDGDSRLWLCASRGHSIINMQFSRLVRCDDDWQPLERCPKDELGRISVQPVGAGSGMIRELVEQLVQEAKRLGANAVVNLRDGRGGTTLTDIEHLTSITAEAVRIDVDPTTC